VPSARATLKDVASSCEKIRKRHGRLKTENPRIWARFNAYLELEMTTYKIKSAKYADAAGHLTRSLMQFPRLNRHFSPGWDIQDVDKK